MNFCDWHPNPFDWYGVALAGCTLVCCYVQNVDDRLPPPRHGQFPIPSIHQRIRSAYNPPDTMLQHSLHRDYFFDKRSVPDLVLAFGMTPVRRKHTWMPKKIRKTYKDNIMWVRPNQNSAQTSNRYGRTAITGNIIKWLPTCIQPIHDCSSINTGHLCRSLFQRK